MDFGLGMFCSLGVSLNYGSVCENVDCFIYDGFYMCMALLFK